ncbi:MAG: GPW/gp25 family protein [Actinomycetota bacterium]|nr:GPW/gp25 family protein [Actinomycetota bacterium]
MNVDFPFRVDTRGRTAATDHEDHVRDLIEQVLFTSPGERVNRPTFGSGLMRLVFDPNRPELATATQLLVQSSLQQWLAEVVQVEDATVGVRDAEVEVTVTYRLVRTQERQVARFRSGPA